MSSGDEISGFDPTTPAPAAKKPPAARPARRAVAGPSKAAVESTTVKKRGQKQQPDESAHDDPEVMVLSSDDESRKAQDTRKETAQQGATAKGKAKDTSLDPKPVPQTNGKPKPKPKTKVKVASAEPAEDGMDVDGAQQEDVPAVRPGRATRTVARTVPSSPSPPPVKRQKTDAALEAENARLRRSLQNLTEQKDRLSAQLKEAIEIRETEPERLLNERMLQYEASMQTNQRLLDEQAKSLAQLRLPESNQSHTLQFITRDAAAEESKDLLKKVHKLEQSLKEKDAALAELRSNYKQLENQLETEEKMAREYREKNPPSSSRLNATNGATRSQPGSSNPVDHDVIKLYEDLTNFLVTHVSRGDAKYKEYPDLLERIFNCTYTYIEPQSEGPNPTLQFTLRHMWQTEPDNEPVTSRKDLVEKMEFTPIGLENESDEFKAGLGFFRDAFVFDRGQMQVFITTMTNALSNIAAAQSGET